MNNDISCIVRMANSHYDGLNISSSLQFLRFLKERNADESTINIFREFRLAGQIALKDGLIFDENQVLIRNEFFDEERTSCKIIIGVDYVYNLILLNLCTLEVFGVNQKYEADKNSTEEPKIIADSLLTFLRERIDPDLNYFGSYLVAKVFDTNFKRMLEAICSVGKGSYTSPTGRFSVWLNRRCLSEKAKTLFSWFMPTKEIIVGSGTIYPVEDLITVNDYWHKMDSCNFLILGSCLNGDYIVIDMNSDNLAVGYITHEEIDPLDSSNYREKYIAISHSIDGFFHDSNFLGYLPDDYYLAKEVEWTC